MSITLKALAGGSAVLQVDGVDRLKIDSTGVVSGFSPPASGDSSKNFATTNMLDSGSATYAAAGVYTFNVSDVLRLGRKRARVKVRAGGGPGGSPVSGWTYKVGGGGGQGGYSEKSVDLSGVSTVTVTVGAGGVPAAAAGTAGGPSSFGVYLSASGGAASVNEITGSGPGVGAGGDVNYRGVPGGHAFMSANTGSPWVIQGAGGGNAGGSLGNVSTAAKGSDGVSNGVGGNGGTGAGALGGSGGVGYISIEW